MIGFVIGTACLIGLVKMARHGSCGRGWNGGCGGYGGGGWHGHHGHGFGRGWHGGGPGDHHEGGGDGGGPWMFQRFVLRRIFERLDTTPGQEKVIVQAVNEAREAIRTSVGEFRNTRDDVAKSVGSESFDETILGGAFAKQDEALANARRAVTGALAKIHEALDTKQRSELADLIAKGPRAWGRYGGPYRA